MFKLSKKTFENFFYLSCAHVALMIIGVAISTIWARYTTLELYGKYQLMMSFVAIVAAFTMPGLSMSAQLSAAKQKCGNLKIIFRKKILFSLVGSFALLCIGSYYFGVKNDTETAFMIFLASFIFPLYNLTTIWESWMTSIGEYKKLSMVQVWYGLISLISLILSIIIFNNIYFLVIVSFATTAVSNVLLINYFKQRSDNDIEDKELISYGYKVSWAMIIPVLISFDKFIISEYLSFEDVAIFAIAMIFPAYIKVLYNIINRLITPKISSADSVHKAWQYLKPKMFGITVLFVLISLIGFFTIEYVIHLLYTDKYAESGIYAKWLWVFTALSVPTTYLGNILRAQQKLRFEYTSYIVTPVVKITSLILFLPFFGLWGAVYSTFLTNIITSIYYILFFKYEMR